MSVYLTRLWSWCRHHPCLPEVWAPGFEMLHKYLATQLADTLMGCSPPSERSILDQKKENLAHREHTGPFFPPSFLWPIWRGGTTRDGWQNRPCPGQHLHLPGGNQEAKSPCKRWLLGCPLVTRFIRYPSGRCWEQGSRSLLWDHDPPSHPRLLSHSQATWYKAKGLVSGN